MKTSYPWTQDPEVRDALEALGPRFRQDVEQASRKARPSVAVPSRRATPSFERVTLPRARRSR